MSAAAWKADTHGGGVWVRKSPVACPCNPYLLAQATKPPNGKKTGKPVSARPAFNRLTAAHCYAHLLHQAWINEVGRCSP